MKELKIDNIPKVKRIRASLKGTGAYTKYNVLHETKKFFILWRYISWGELPYLIDGHFKTTKSGTYLYSKDNSERWLLNDTIIRILEG